MNVKSVIAVDFDPSMGAYWACVATGQYDSRNRQVPICMHLCLTSGSADSTDKIMPELIKLASDIAKDRFRASETEIRYIGGPFMQNKRYYRGMTVQVYRNPDFEKIPDCLKYLYAKASEHAKKRINCRI